MLKIKTITIKNFMSVGEVPQKIYFDKGNSLTLILGENLDTANDDSVGRNGVGKSCILNALSYSLFGVALTNIKKDNLVNNINAKNMFVIVEFEINGIDYKIERGRKPLFFKFIQCGTEIDDTQGESKLTQEEVEKLLGFSHLMFKNIIALNTYTDAFLSMNTKTQREFIEELLGIKVLSEKADILKDLIRESKDDIRSEEIKNNAKEESNNRITKALKDLERSSMVWDTRHKEKLNELASNIAILSEVNIEEEIENHKKVEAYNIVEQEVYRNAADYDRIEKLITDYKIRISNAKRDIDSAEKEVIVLKKEIMSYIEDLDKTHAQRCPVCYQGLHDNSHIDIVANLEKRIKEIKAKIKNVRRIKIKNIKEERIVTLEEEIKVFMNQLHEVATKLSKNEEQLDLIPQRPNTIYNSAEEAFGHRSSIENMEKDLTSSSKEINPFMPQIESMTKTAIQDIDLSNLNSLTYLYEHQTYLFNLLTKRESFIRKQIIDQTLSYLNQRLFYYLEKLKLPHQVKFINDLTVEINHNGYDLDFDNLSRGERTRLILALCWSFRDIFELSNHQINLLFIDELLDNGLDGQGVENSMRVIQQFSRENKEVYVISHREELISKINNVLRVVKQDNFTELFMENDYAL